jgi:hypothetical protein
MKWRVFDELLQNSMKWISTKCPSADVCFELVALSNSSEFETFKKLFDPKAAISIFCSKIRQNKTQGNFSQF